MKFHPHVIEKLIYLFENYGGHLNNEKLRRHLSTLDVSVYERKEGRQELIVVLTEQLAQELGKK